VGLVEVFTAWRDVALQYLADDGEPTPGVEFSANALALQKAAPQMTWVPTTEQIKWTVVGENNNANQPIAQRALRGRVVTVELWIWGRDFDNAEAMIGAAVAAWHDTFWGYDDAIAVDWTRGQATTAKSGVLAILTLTLELPLTRQPEALATITNFTPMGQQVADPALEVA